MNRLFKFLLAFMACLHLCGGPLGMLQGAAWAKMLVTYSQREGVVEGVKQTFDGDHPCAMCRALAKARAGETKAPEDKAPRLDASKLAKSFSLWEKPTAPVSTATAVDLLPAPAPVELQGRDGLAPSTPPPRVA